VQGFHKICHREPLVYFQRRGDLMHLGLDRFASLAVTLPGFLVKALNFNGNSRVLEDAFYYFTQI
jgi:hypothetical protein